MGWGNDVAFEVLKGKRIDLIEGLTRGSDKVTFLCSDGTSYVMLHNQDCCESVSIEEIFGDPADLVGHEILQAEIVDGPLPTEAEDKESTDYGYRDSFTWTFYKLATIKGSVTIRWYGTSNGYYSEGVGFEEVKSDQS